MRLVSYNIQYSRGKDECFDLARVIESVANADIIALQEVERYWPRTGMTDQPALIGKLLPEYHWIYAPFFDMHARESGTQIVKDNRRRQFGTMLLARAPIVWSRCHPLPKVASVSHFNMDTGALEALIETRRGPVRFFSLHLSALDVEERLMQAEHLLAINARAIREGAAWTGASTTGVDVDWAVGEPPPSTGAEAVLMGDFNSEPHDKVYERFVGAPDMYGRRVHRVDTFVDSWAEVHGEEIGDVTWMCPPGYPADRDMRLDYCFVSSTLSKHISNAWVDSEAQGSDHQPYWVEIDL